MKKQFTELIGVCFTLVLLLIGTTGAQAQYCIPGTSGNGSEWLAGVEFAGIDNPTPTSPATSYSDFTGQVGVVVPGVTYEFIGTIGEPIGSTWPETITVFIDFNQDEVFDNTTERFDIGTSCATNGCQLIADILVPLDATPGVTRMRVMQNYFSAIIDPCLSEGFTETEDYSLLIGGDCSPPLFTYNIIDDCDLFTYEVEATLNDFSDNTFITIFIERSDDVEVDPVTIPSILLGQTISLVEEVPFGVTLTASIEGFDPVCNQTRTWSEHGLCPPQNNECETATELFCGDAPINGSNLNASPYPDGTDICNLYASPSGAVWYEWTAPYNAIMQTVVSYGDIYFDYQVAVLDGSCGEFTCLGGIELGQVTWNATMGETYYLMVFGWGTAVGDFTIGVNCTELTCDFPELTAIAVDSEGAEITSDDCLDINDTYNVSVSLAGGAGNETFTVTVGDSVKTMVADETHIFGDFSPAAPVNVTVIGDDEALCDADAILSPAICPPMNNDCETAQVLECGVPVNGTNLNASPYPIGTDICGLYESPSGAVWYQYTAPYNAFVQTAVDYGDVYFDYQVVVLDGSCGDFLCLGGVELGQVQFSAAAGETYYIMVFGWGTATGNFEIAVNCDQIFCDFPDVTATAVDAEGVEIAEECVEFGTEYYVYTTLDGGEGNDSYVASIGAASTTLLPGENYTFGPYTADNAVLTVNTVGDLDTDCNTSTLLLLPICPPENDDCANATEVTCNGDNYVGSNIGANDDFTCNFNGIRSGVWFHFNSETEVEVSLETCNPGTTFDTDLSVFTGTCGDLTCFTGFSGSGWIDGVSNCAYAGYAAGGPGAVFTAEAGVDYYFLLHGYGTGDLYTGSYELSVSCVDIACSPTVTAAAVDVDSNPITECVDQQGEYYVMVDLAGGTSNDYYNVSVNGSAPIQIAAEGSGVVGPVPATVVANVSVVGVSQVTCSGTAATAVDVCPPSNDMPCGAIALTADGTMSTFTNVNATADAGEVAPPISNCNTGWCELNVDGSVWFTFVAPPSGRAEISTCGPTSTANLFNSQVAVYSATDCNDYGTFALLGANDYYQNATCGFYGSSIATVCVEPGETYYVQVDGYYGDADPFNLTVTEVDGAICACQEPVFPLEGFTFADTSPICDEEDQTFSLTFYSFEDMGTSDGFIYTYAYDGNEPITVLMPEGGEPFTVPETWPLGTEIAVTVNLDDPNCEGYPNSIYPLAANITQDAFACIPPPENDICADAIALSCDDYVTGSSINASEYTGCNGQPRQTVWYTFTSELPGSIFLTTCHEETVYDTDISMFTGTCEEDLVCFPGWGGGGYIDGNSACSFQGFAAEGTFEAEAGVTYYIALSAYYVTDGATAFEGDYGLSVTCTLDDAAFVNGTVDWDANCGDRDLTVDFYEPGTDVLVASYTGLVNAAGEFTLPAVEIGTFDVITKVDGFIATGMQDVVVTTGPNSIDVGSIIAGDINGDNGVNIQDVSFMIAAFGSTTGDPNFNVLADVNCDGGVNIQDVSTVIAGFNQQGAQAPLL